MPITLNCACGRTLRVPDAHAGKRAKCPDCQAILPIPKAEPEFEVVEDDEPQKLAPKPKRAAAVVDDDDDDPKPKKKVRAVVEEDDDDEPPPKKKKKKRQFDDDDDEDDRPRRKGGGAGSDTAMKLFHIIGGVLMVAGGIACMVFGHQPEHRRPYRIVILGGCLVFVGIGTIVRGITGNFDD